MLHLLHVEFDAGLKIEEILHLLLDLVQVSSVAAELAHPGEPILGFLEEVEQVSTRIVEVRCLLHGIDNILLSSNIQRAVTF